MSVARWICRTSAVLYFAFATLLHAQLNLTQQLAFAGLHSAGSQGQITAVKTDASGNLFLLLNQNDGVRILKTDPTGSNVLAQVVVGAKGDIGLAMALDPLGKVYVAGTTNSTTLTGTPAAAIPNRTDTSTNSFVARFDPNTLAEIFLTFTGASKISATAVTATADAVFVTGNLYGTNLPVTGSAIQQAPATGSSQNGFVERFSSTGTSLVYATYLTGVNGNTAPTAIAADTSDDAYVAGSTTSTGYPTIAALVPVSLSNPSGFLTRLTPAADGITFSTFVPGAGLSAATLDSTGSTLLLSGAVALGQFPVDTVAHPLVPLTYQTLLRMPLDGSSVLSATVIAPGAQSSLAAATGGSVWLAGTLSAQLLPGPTLATLGTGYAARVTSGNALDQTARFGGLPDANPTFASLPTNLTSVAVDASGDAIVGGSVAPTASSSLLATETYDLPLVDAPTTALPSTIRTSETTAALCSGSLCSGSAAYVAKLNPNTSAPALAFSADNAPELILRNLGSAAASGLAVTASGATITSDCGTTLNAGAECVLLLSGTGPATVTASAANAYATVQVPAYTAATATLYFSPKELDFGILTSASGTASQTVTVANPGTSTQTFTSKLDAATTVGSPFTQTGTDCPTTTSATTYSLAAGAICHLQLGFTAFAASTADGYEQAQWSIAGHDVLLTGYSQAASLSLSATELDFGTQFSGGLKSPRYLYISHSSSASVTHTTVASPAGSPFTVTDGCPSTLNAASVCRIRLDYSSSVTSNDSTTLTLDAGLSVLVTGHTLPQPGIGSTVSDPNLAVTPTTITFPDAVVVTAASGSTETVAITNSGSGPFSLTLALSGDFTDVTSCGNTLAGGATCAVTLTFVPTQPGTRSGLLTIMAGANFSPVYVSLSGTGLALLPVTNDAITFGSVPVGQPAVQSFQITQPLTSLTATTTGPYTLTLVQNSGFGFGDPPSSAYATSATAACPGCFLGVQFIPTAAGSEPGTLTLSSSGGGQPYVIQLSGAGTGTSGLVLTPVARDFGSVPVHSTGGAVLFTLTNLVATGTAVMVTAPTVSGDFVISSAISGGQPCTGSLGYTASCLIELQFSPTATGTRAGTLTVSTSGGSASAALTGTGTGDPGFALNPTALSFANVPGSTATVQSVSVTNTGTASLQIGAGTLGTSSFGATGNCGTLAPAASCSFTVTFTPGSASAADTLSFPITMSAAGGSTNTVTASVALSGTYTSATAGIQIVPGQATFSATTTATQGQTLLLTLNNLTAKTLALNLTLPQGFALAGAPCTALAANGSCSFSVQSIPLTNGAVTGSLFVEGTPSDGSAQVNGLAYLEGYGMGVAGTLTITGPLQAGNILNFGQVASGQTVSQTLTLTNSSVGAEPITIRRITSPPPFLATTTCVGALAAGVSCTVTVTYAPVNQVASGSSPTPATTNTGQLTIESDANSSPATINLSGQAGPIAVTGPANAAVLATYALSEGSLVFASTPVGNTSSPQTISLTNTGTTTIQVSAVTATANFMAGNGCSALSAGASCVITVASTPQTAGTHIDSLEISSNASDALEYVSLLSGAVTPTLTLTPRSVSFGPQLVSSTSAAQSILATNTGSAAITFTGISATGDFTPGGNCPGAGAMLAAGANCTIQVTFTPTASGSRTGTLSVASSGSSAPLTVTLTGTGTQAELTLSPAALTFGSVAQGSSAPLLETLTNNGTTAITGLAFAATGDFAVTFPCSATTLAPGASCTAQITFRPIALGARTGTLTVTSSDPGSPATVALTGTATAPAVTPAVGKLIVAPSSLAFGNVAQGSSAFLTLTLANGGNGNLSGIALTATGDYAVTTPCATTLAPGASCTVQLNFTPAALGARPGTLTITSSDPASPATVALNGTGVSVAPPVTAGGFTLQVDGGPSASATVTGGSPGAYTLTVTPTGGYSGPVALTCTPINAGEYSSCAIQPSSLALNGSAQNAVVQINTLTEAAALRTPDGPPLIPTFVCLLLPGLAAVWKARRALRSRIPVLLALLFTAWALIATGCGGKHTTTTSNLLQTPPGTYQYTVTASATGGTPAAQSVTLTLVVQ